MILRLPFPHKELMPNRKNGRHWGSVKKFKDADRDGAHVQTRVQMAHHPKLTDKTIAIQITYIQADRYHRDLDNLLAASKATLDGVAMALGVDDKVFEPITLKRGFDKVARMEIEIIRLCSIAKKETT